MFQKIMLTLIALIALAVLYVEVDTNRKAQNAWAGVYWYIIQPTERARELQRKRMEEHGQTPTPQSSPQGNDENRAAPGAPNRGRHNCPRNSRDCRTTA